MICSMWVDTLGSMSGASTENIAMSRLYSSVKRRDRSSGSSFAAFAALMILSSTSVMLRT